jgi:chaperonin GroEL
MRGILKVAAVKAPGFGDRRKAMLEDIAILTGATVISEETGLTLEKTTLEHLGSAKRIEVGKDDTPSSTAPASRSASRRASRPSVADRQATSDYDKEKLQERVAKLAGGVAVIKVGAATEVEMKEKAPRRRRAARHTRGGRGRHRAGRWRGAAARAAVTSCKARTATTRHGIQIVLRALEAPLRVIAANAGDEPSVVIAKVLEGKATSATTPPPASTATWSSGVIDPTKVTAPRCRTRRRLRR